jgi:hypothetical protein
MNQLSVAATPGTVEQRKHDRHTVEMPGLARLPEIRGGIYVITVLDVSISGLRFTCPRDVPVGSRVEINCQSARVFGTVRYVRELEDVFHVGIEADLMEGAGQPKSEEIDLTSLFRREIRKTRTT